MRVSLNSRPRAYDPPLRLIRWTENYVIFESYRDAVNASMAAGRDDLAARCCRCSQRDRVTFHLESFENALAALKKLAHRKLLIEWLILYCDSSIQALICAGRRGKILLWNVDDVTSDVNGPNVRLSGDQAERTANLPLVR